MKSITLSIFCLFALIHLISCNSSKLCTKNINQFDDKGLPIGVWITEDSITKQQIIAHYKNGKLHGCNRAFHTNGKIARIGRYKNGLKVGVWKFYMNIKGDSRISGIQWYRKGEIRRNRIYNVSW